MSVLDYMIHSIYSEKFAMEYGFYEAILISKISYFKNKQSVESFHEAHPYLKKDEVEKALNHLSETYFLTKIFDNEKVYYIREMGSCMK